MRCFGAAQTKTHPRSSADGNVAVQPSDAELVNNEYVTMVNADTVASVGDDTLGWDVIPRTPGSSSDQLHRYMRTVRDPVNGHTKAITSLMVLENQPSESGATAPPLLVTASEDGTARLWELFSGKYIRTFSDRDGKPLKRLLSVAVADFAIGAVVVTGCEDGSAHCWDLHSGAKRCSLTGIHAKGIATILLTLASNTPLAAVGSQDKSGSIWNLKEGTPMFKFSDQHHTDLLLSLTLFIPQSTQQPALSDLTFISASWDKAVMFWKLDNGTPYAKNPAVKEVHPYRQLVGHTKSVTTIVAHFASATDKAGVTRSFPVLVTGSLDKTAIVWELETGNKIHILKGHLEQITAVAVFSGQSEVAPVVLTASLDKTVILWDLMSGHRIRTLPYTAKISCMSVLQHQHGIVAVTGSADGHATTWNLVRSERIRKLFTGNVTGIGTFEPREREPATTKVMIADVVNKATVFDLHSNARLQELEAHALRLNSLIVYTPQDPRACASFITCSADSKIKVWDALTHECRGVLSGHRELVFALSLYDPARCHPSTRDRHPSLSRPLVISGGLDKHVRFWDISDTSSQDQNHDSIPDAHKALVRCLAVYHPQVEGEDPLVVSGSYDLSAKVWNLRTRELVHELRGHREYVFLLNVYDPIYHMQSAEEAHKRNLDAPLLVTGSYDRTCIVWDMRTGEQLRTLEGHKESVTAMDLYTPRNPDEPPLLITGSIDRLVIVWNVWTGEQLQTLVGHTDRVCCIHVYHPRNHSEQPFIISGSDDKSTIIWEDALYSASYMPLRDAVNRTFLADLLYEDWPLITEFAQKYKLALFIENSNLFFLAVKHRRPDFLLKFRPYLSRCLRCMKAMGGRSLLEYALELSDLVSVRAILLSWTENLNADITDLLTQNVFHASYFFLTLKELLPLSVKYPLEYVLFISSLRLVRNHPALLQNVTELKLDAVDRYEIKGTNERAALFKDLWYDTFLSDTFWSSAFDLLAVLTSRVHSAKQPVTSLFLPLRHPAELIDGFGAFAAVSDQLQNVDIFNSPVGIYSVAYFWQTQGRQFHVFSMLHYLVLLGLFIICLCIYQFQYERGQHVLEDVAMNALIVLVILAFVEYLYEEYSQIRNMYSGQLGTVAVLSHFLRDFWNIVDMLIPLTGVAGLGLLLVEQKLSAIARSFLATCSIMLWFKVLYYMRPFSSSGPLVVMIIRIAKDIRFFLLVLFCVMVGFAQAFWLLSNIDHTLAFGTVPNALLNSFLYMLGNAESDFTGTVAPNFATFLLVIFLLSMTILMLNLLVALMGDTFSAVRAQGQALWRKEQTAIISEQAFLIPGVCTHDFLHVLKYTSDLATEENESVIKLQTSIEESLAHVPCFNAFVEDEGCGDKTQNETEARGGPDAEETNATAKRLDEIEERLRGIERIEKALQELLAVSKPHC